MCCKKIIIVCVYITENILGLNIRWVFEKNGVLVEKDVQMVEIIRKSRPNKQEKKTTNIWNHQLKMRPAATCILKPETLDSLSLSLFQRFVFLSFS